MAWSTKQLADLVGVSLRSIRHWHDVGLLPEPERLSNSYKQYDGSHLVQALRIAKLTRLGFRLDRIVDMLHSEELGRQSLVDLRAEIDGRIAELERLRAEADELIGLGLSPDLSPSALLAMDVMGDDLGSRNLAIVLTHLISQDDAATLFKLLGPMPTMASEITEDFLSLPDDGSEDAITRLTERIVAMTTKILSEHSGALLPTSYQLPEKTLNEVLMAVAADNMNTAQQRVMKLALAQFGND